MCPYVINYDLTCFLVNSMDTNSSAIYIYIYIYKCGDFPGDSPLPSMHGHRELPWDFPDRMPIVFRMMQ